MTFLKNKHTERYMQICETAQARNSREEYHEEHWIVPLLLGGSRTDESNIARLTPEEHYECHELLIKMVGEPEQIRHMEFMLDRLRHDCPTGRKRKMAYEDAASYGAMQREKNTTLSDWREFTNEMDKYRPIERVRKVGNPPPLRVWVPTKIGGGKKKLVLRDAEVLKQNG